MATQAARRQESRKNALKALSKFLENRNEAEYSLKARLEKISIPSVKGFWPLQQKRVNHQLFHANQQLTSLLQHMLKEQRKTAKETAKVLKMLIALSDDGSPESDSE